MESTHAVARGGLLQPVLRVTGAGLLAATAAIHLDLYLTGYKDIPTIGPLFLLQIIAAFVLAAAVLATGNRVVAALGAGFAVATLAGYLLSIWIGLFGFTEVRTTAGIVAGIIEVAAFAVLAFMTVAPAAGQPAQPGPLDRLVAAIPAAGALIAGVSVVALVLLGVAAGTAGSSSTVASSNGLKVVQIGGVSVLANANGFTLYWFAPDTATKSVCNGSCAAYWPPVKGPVTAGPGIPGKLTTIKRADGSVQAAYDGHPLYTYVGDSAPGQARGNNLNLNGGLWHEVTTSG
jgi:predicted lipoprotein with Yx(FWY)xxD motif